MRFVDLSMPLDDVIPVDPPFLRPTIDYKDHIAGRRDMEAMYGIRPDQLPDGQGLAAETLTLTTHSGTHVDAPWHYHPTMNRGERAWTIDEVPLDWFFRPGVKLDLRHLPQGHLVTAADIDAELDRIGYALRPFDIVLAHTIASAAYGQEDYYDTGIGFGREATLHLTDRGVRVVGTDAWGWDAPVSVTRREFARTGDPSIVWEGHKAGAEVAYCQIEKLQNLESLPAFGFTVACFPAKVRAASAGWTRAVAIFDE
ncbi:cyclase family protein [Microbacterium sp. SORGH_AS_0862]|uniref:cyclase family protein n=1 Tax=Microbacterium sp. SORGH_AS_0862 TaxID=3041789 RepID=UPI00278FD24E|nr:cyclase family protein [Microbacterium sp. SORGH_AS_0862]MDQ1204817.1 kynurenine formamidase [Microbacterium sp. SORGH_AS_0862]